MIRACVLSLVLLALAAQPAAAAKPRFLGSGGDPGVAVDAAGTAHVAWWEEDAGGAAFVHYCQVPRRARACALTRMLPAPPSSEPSGLQVAAGPKGGWIVWDGGPGLSDDEPIRIVRLRRPR